jgi:hypothetical protein
MVPRVQTKKKLGRTNLLVDFPRTFFNRSKDRSGMVLGDMRLAFLLLLLDERAHVRCTLGRVDVSLSFWYEGG